MFLSSYQETQVEGWEKKRGEQKMLWEQWANTQAFPQFLQVLQNFHECFAYSEKHGEHMFHRYFF